MMLFCMFWPPLDILTCNSANKQSFQHPTKGLFAQCSVNAKDALFAELQA